MTMLVRHPRRARRSAQAGRPPAEGQATIEFALAFPIFFGLLITAIQLGLLLVWYGDEVRLTRDSARWLALHPSATDDAVAAQIRSMMFPAIMVGGVPVFRPIQGNTNDLVDDDNALAVYQIGNLTARFTPCLPNAATPPLCTHRDRSADGGTSHVQLSYDASNIIFLPTQLNLGYITLRTPTALPLYDAWMTTE